MALISPGVEVQVFDESQYTPTAAGTVAYVLLATAQDKQTPTGTLASYTTKATAGQLQSIVSQRDLVQKYGTIEFQVDASDNPIHGDERNEYGLLAAYSALGVANRLYIQRADVDLNQLEGTAIRPTGTATDGTYWLDISNNTNWGITEWTETGFALQIPTVITDPALAPSGIPLNSIGAIGSYVVVPTSTSNPVWYKRYDNTWVTVGSDDWKDAVPAVTGTTTNISSLGIGQKMIINGKTVTLSGTDIDSVVDDINGTPGLTGVSASKNAAGQLQVYVDSLASSVGNTTILTDGLLVITKGNTLGAGNVDCAANLGLLQTDQATTVTSGGNVYTYSGPTVQFSNYRNVPAWSTSDDTPRPYGSVWFKTSATGNGANWAVSEYDAVLDSWVRLSAPLYANDNAANFALDPTGGGGSIAIGSVYVRYDILNLDPADEEHSNGSGTFKLYRKASSGLLKVSGTVLNPTIDAADSFQITVSVPGTSVTQSATINLSGTTATTFVQDILSVNLPNITAAVEGSGSTQRITITHLAGGTIEFVELAGTPIQDAGLHNPTNVQTVITGTYLASPWTELVYFADTNAPYSDPEDGTLWYYNTPLEVDILINSPADGGWVGYLLVNNDARGYDLSATNPNGPILSATRPTTQDDGTTPVVPGDLWIDTSDLENYPVIYRYTGAAWELIDNTDQITTDGIVFADARWGADDTIDPVTDDLPSIADLASSDYHDSDCPDYRLFARGTLLFNTRRSGFNVKRFESEWFNDKPFVTGNVPTGYTAGNLPSVKGAWVSSSGADANAVPYMGRKAQRNVVVEALKAAITSSTELREEQTQFNLIVCPGYPELIQNMIALNNDRKQTAFIIGDSPLDITSSSVEAWANNSGLALDNGPNGLVSSSEYLGVYYPAGLGTDLAGETVVVPSSHMMLRTYIRSDGQSYPWFAPAGVRRGVIDNVSSIGYVDNADGGTFKSIGVTVGLRDILYENRVNPLTVLPGVGLVAYGQKTRAAQTSAMDRVNVARLVVYLRLVLDKVARPFIFEPNDTITRNQVKAGFEAVLNDVVAKRGLYDYLVVCDTTNNTPDRIDRNELYVDIAIKPVKAIEFIYVPVRIRNTGATL